MRSGCSPKKAKNWVLTALSISSRNTRKNPLGCCSLHSGSESVRLKFQQLAPNNLSCAVCSRAFPVRLFYLKIITVHYDISMIYRHPMLKIYRIIMFCIKRRKKNYSSLAKYAEMFYYLAELIIKDKFYLIAKDLKLQKSHLWLSADVSSRNRLFSREETKVESCAQL